MYEYIVKYESNLTQVYDTIMYYVSQHRHVFIHEWTSVKVLLNFDL